jgi:hypothetical protein
LRDLIDSAGACTERPRRVVDRLADLEFVGHGSLPFSARSDSSRCAPLKRNAIS